MSEHITITTAGTFRSTNAGILVLVDNSCPSECVNKSPLLKTQKIQFSSLSEPVVFHTDSIEKNWVPCDAITGQHENILYVQRNKYMIHENVVFVICTVDSMLYDVFFETNTPELIAAQIHSVFGNEINSNTAIGRAKMALKKINPSIPSCDNELFTTDSTFDNIETVLNKTNAHEYDPNTALGKAKTVFDKVSKSTSSINESYIDNED